MKVPVDQPRKKKWSMAKLLERLSRLRSFLNTLLLWLIVVTAIYMLYDGLTSRAYIVESITTPDSLVASGYTPAVLSGWMVDRMHDIQANAATRKELNSLTTGASQLDIEVPGSGISVKKLIRLLGKVFGIPERTISGEIVDLGSDRYRMHLRVNSIGEGLRIVELEGGIEELIARGGEEATRLISPYLLAAYKYAALPPEGSDEDADHLLELIDELIELCLSNATAEDDAWGLNLRGVVLQRSGHYSKAVRYFQRALEIDAQFASAHWNWSNSLLGLGKPVDALDYYRKATQTVPAMTDQGAEMLLDIAGVLRSKGNDQDATALYEEVMQLTATAMKTDLSWRRRYAVALDRIGGDFYVLSRDYVGPPGEDDQLRQFYDRKMIEASRQAVVLDPLDVTVVMALGRRYSYLEQYDLAITQYREALILVQDHADSEAGAEICAKWKKDLDDALEAGEAPQSEEYERLCD